MTPENHLTDEQALDFVGGRLNSDDQEAAIAHLAGCGSCETAVAYWRRVEEAAASKHTTEPPAGVMRRAIAVFDPAALPVSTWKRLLASWVFDSRLQTALAGVRDAGTAFQLLAQVEDVEIDLLCEPDGDNWRITGQLVVEEPTLRSTARISGSKAAEVALNDEGEFRFQGIPGGEVWLEVETAFMTVALQPFRLGGRAD
jgi:hypothetical protein